LIVEHEQILVIPKKIFIIELIDVTHHLATKEAVYIKKSTKCASYDSQL